MAWSFLMLLFLQNSYFEVYHGGIIAIIQLVYNCSNIMPERLYALLAIHHSLR